MAIEYKIVLISMNIKIMLKKAFVTIQHNIGR